MKYGLKELGWYLAWDKDGRYPIDNSKPIEIIPKNGVMSLWLTHRPIQQEDGSWVKYDLFPFGEVSSVWGYAYGQLEQFKHFTFLDLGELKHNKSETDIKNIDLKYLRIIHGDKPLCDYKPQDNQTKLLIVNNQSDLYFATQPTYRDDADGNKLLKLKDNTLSIKRQYYKDITIELDFYLRNYNNNIIVSNMFFDLEFNSDTRDFIFTYKPIVGEHIVLPVYIEDIYQLHKMKVAINEDGIIFNFNGKIKEYKGFIYMQPEEFVYNNQELTFTTTGNGTATDRNNHKGGDRGLRNKTYNVEYWKEKISGKIDNYVQTNNTTWNYSVGGYKFNSDQVIIPGDQSIKITIKNIMQPFFIGLSLNPLYFIHLRKTVTKYNYKTGKLEDTETWTLL